MDFRQLKYYREIVKQGSISKAAEKLYIAQPPLSQLLKKMEKELGTTLILRYREEWEVTETGRLLYQYAESILSQAEEVTEHIHNIEAGEGGTVRIGVSSACANMLMDYIEVFREKFERIKIDILTLDSVNLQKKLDQKEIDIALLLRLDNAALYEVKTLKKEPAVFIVPESWSDSLSEVPTLNEISRLPFIMLGEMEGHSFYGDVLDAFKMMNAQPNIIAECKDISMVVALVNRAIGVSIIPRMEYKSTSFENLKIYESHQFDFSVEPVMIKLKDKNLSKASRRFWDIVE